MANNPYDVILPDENQRLLHVLAKGPHTSQKRLDLLLWAESISLIQGFDVLLAPQTVNFTPFPYQVETAEAVLHRLRGRAILGDEVGLGKTIEAGLICPTRGKVVCQEHQGQCHKPLPALAPGEW